MQQHEHFRIERARDEKGAFVTCDLVVYYGGGNLSDYYKRPSHSFWMVPGTTEQETGK